MHDEATLVDGPSESQPPSPAAGTSDDGAAEPPARSGWRLWRPSVVAGLVTWAAGLLMYCLATAVAWLPTQDVAAKAGDPPVGVHEAVDMWSRWDTPWYVLIADSGYKWDGRSTAFFPLYPMLVRLVHTVLPLDTFRAALTVSALAALAALILVHRFVQDAIDGEHARRATYYLLAFPTGFYLIAAYNESLFIALAVGSLYCMRKGHWVAAGALSGLASGTRMLGVLLGLAFAYEYLRQRDFAVKKIRWDALGILLVPTGLLLYMYYLQRAFGDPFYFTEVQKIWFRDGYQAPWTTISDTFHLIGTSDRLLHPDAIRNVYNVGTALLAFVFFALALFGPWRLGPENHYLLLFSFWVVLLPIVNPIHNYYPLSSMMRYVLECLPIFMVLARMGRNNAFDRIFTMASIGVQGVMVVTFVQNNFVA